MTHIICPNCGANLDFGEKCDCCRENDRTNEDKKEN